MRHLVTYPRGKIDRLNHNDTLSVKVPISYFTEQFQLYFSFLIYVIQGNQTTFMPIPKKVDITYTYEEYKVNHLGPTPPTLDDVLHKG